MTKQVKEVQGLGPAPAQNINFSIDFKVKLASHHGFIVSLSKDQVAKATFVEGSGLSRYTETKSLQC